MTGSSMALLGATLLEVGQHGATYLWVTTGVAGALGALTWWAFFHLGNQVNTRFHMKPLHHFCCGLAAAVTVFSVFVFSGLNFVGFVTRTVVDSWAVAVEHDSAWQNQVFRKAYEAVYAQKDKLGLDFTNYPPPDQGGHMIPYTSDSNAVVSQIYAKEMVRNFKDAHPFLVKILWPRSDEAENRLIGDIKKWFEQNQGSYRLDRGVTILQQIIQGDMQTKIPRVIWICRIVLVVVFVLLQIGLGACIVRAALDDIKVRGLSHKKI